MSPLPPDPDSATRAVTLAQTNSSRPDGALERPIFRIALMVVLVLIFGWLAQAAWSHPAPSFDTGPLLWFHAHATPLLNQIMLTLTTLSDPPEMAALLALALLALVWKRLFRQAAALFLLAGGAEGLDLLLKVLFHRSRPVLWTTLIPESDFSFPSGHALFTAALLGAALVWCWNTRWRVPVLLLGGAFTVLVGLSRVYIGVHFPSDILAAWCLAALWIVLLLPLAGRWFQPRLRP